MSDKVRLGRYQHYKGNFYQVIGVARHSETLEKLVVYRALYKGKFGRNSLWVRPAKIFFQRVRIGAKQVPRFRFLKRLT